MNHYCIALALFAVARLAAAQDQHIIPAAGDYRVMDLVLEKAGEKNAPLRVRGATRNGKLPVPSAVSLRDIIHELKVDGTSIQGTYYFPGVAHAGVGQGAAPGEFAINATVADGKVTGTWTSGDKRTGTITGAARTEAELATANAFQTKADWPDWSGPFTSMAATPCGLKLVDDFNKEARLVWRSEELVPRGPGNSLNYEPLALIMQSNGGGASLVVAEGKVFVNYYQPAGTDYMDAAKSADAKDLGPVARLEKMGRERKPPITEISQWMKEKFLTKADDVVVCMDAATGKTLWKNVFAGKSMNQPSHKGGAVNNTPCVGGGKVFAMGPGGTLHGIEIATGKVLWERTGMSAEKVQPWSGARNMCAAPIYAGDTLILPDHAATLTGIDPATGKDLWKLPGKSTKFQVPAKWSHQGKEYVLSLSDPTAKGGPAPVHCIEPATGKILWSLELGSSPSKGVTMFGDTMMAMINLEGTAVTGSVATTGNAKCVAYRLTLTKPELLWQMPCPYVSLHTLPASNGKHVILAGKDESRLLDAATGRELATYKGPGPYNEGHIMLCEDRVFLSLDGSHGHSEMVILGATPETFSKALCTWDQPHPQTTSYHNKHMTFPTVEGRIFFRGTDGVYCYDMRAAAK